MIIIKQEYLFSKECDINDIEDMCEKNNFKGQIHHMPDVEYWILEINSESNKLQDAEKLSDINKEIETNYEIIVLTNESAAYFNQRLFPLYNEFERKLRAFLYLASSLRKEKNDKIIENLESKDLGEIFTLLFTDSDFVKKCRSKIKETSWDFTKKYILNTLSKIDEKTLWDSLVGDTMVPTLSNEFDKVREYRNSIMHAHNIDKEKFKYAKELIVKINSELDLAILTLKNTTSKSITSDFNDMIYEAMTNMYHSHMEKMVELFAGIYPNVLDKNLDKEITKKVLENYIDSNNQVAIAEQDK